MHRSSFEVDCFECFILTHTHITYDDNNSSELKGTGICHAEVTLIVCRLCKYLKNDTRARAFHFFFYVPSTFCSHLLESANAAKSNKNEKAENSFDVQYFLSLFYRFFVLVSFRFSSHFFFFIFF